jgi:hypothetical protein
MIRIKSVVVALTATALVALAGCADAQHRDAEPGGVDNSPADVISFPDGFRNVAHKCDGPNMIYSASRGDTSSDTSVAGSIAVVANDPRCVGVAK